MTLFIVSSVMVSCEKREDFNCLEQSTQVGDFVPQCNQGKNLDTTIQVKIALMLIKMIEDNNFDQKIDLLRQEISPTEQKYYDILGYNGFRINTI